MKRFLAGILAAQMVFPIWAAAQQPALAPAPVPQAPAMLPGSLKILVLEGQGAVNNVERGLATPPVVEVRDRDDRPVEAATVIFRLPPSGPGGSFPGPLLSNTVVTNVQGQATAAGFAPNKMTGGFKIHVTATAGVRMGELDIAQTNSESRFSMAPEPPRRKVSWKKWAIIGGIGVGAAIGIILATRGSSSAASSNPTITITPGPVVIGGR